MIEAKAQKSESGYCLEVSGHAGYACSNDIVCAAVSALVDAYVTYLEEYDGAGVEIDLGDGYAEILISERDAAWDMVLCGMYAIANAYPDYVMMTTTYI